MALPAIIGHNGALNGSPSGTTTGVPSLIELINTSFQSVYGSSKSSRPSIVGATDLIPYVVALETIVKVRVIVIRVRGGGLKMKLTSAAGVDQVIPISDIIVWHSPNAGDEITSIKLVGTADVELVLAGDVT